MAARLCDGCDRIIPDGHLCVRCRGRARTRNVPAPDTRCQVTLVYGPPCAGKSTHVREHAHPGDLVVDFDAIIAAIGAPDHEHPEPLKAFAFDAVDAVMRRLATGDHLAVRAWVIRSAPTRAEREPFEAGQVVALVPPAQVCHDRAERERPAVWHRYIDDWFARYEP